MIIIWKRNSRYKCIASIYSYPPSLATVLMIFPGLISLWTTFCSLKYFIPSAGMKGVVQEDFAYISMYMYVTLKGPNISLIKMKHHVANAYDGNISCISCELGAPSIV